MVNETNTAHQLGWEGSTVRARGLPLLTLKTPSLTPIPPDASPPSSSPQPWTPNPGAQLTAIAMAMSASVTVSMGEEVRGVFSVIFRVRAEVRS